MNPKEAVIRDAARKSCVPRAGFGSSLRGNDDIKSANIYSFHVKLTPRRRTDLMREQQDQSGTSTIRTKIPRYSWYKVPN